jgi:hypothetical protein
MNVSTTSGDLKSALLRALLDEHPTVLVHVDGRGCTGLPAPHDTEPRLPLRLGWALTPSVALMLGRFGFECTLLIGHVEHRVQVPWAMLWAVIGERHGACLTQVVWPEFLPNTDVAPVRETDVPKRGGLRLVE